MVGSGSVVTAATGEATSGDPAAVGIAPAGRITVLTTGCRLCWQRIAAVRTGRFVVEPIEAAVTAGTASCEPSPNGTFAHTAFFRDLADRLAELPSLHQRKCNATVSSRG
jgi:hypothetical protein